MGRFARVLAAAQAMAAPLIPPACALCRTPVTARNVLCPDCWKDVAFLNAGGCGCCGKPVLGAAEDPDPRCDDCLRMPPPWERGRAVFRYDGGGRRLVMALKHGDRVDTLPLLGQWLAQSGQDVLADADLVVPVPLHWQRRLKRRFNQAAGLGQAACRAAGRRDTFAPMALVRGRFTQDQGEKNRTARADNVAGVFRPGSQARRLQGARVLLVDDVLTTGATLAECARACLSAGASAVDVLVLALVVSDKPHYMATPNEDDKNETS